MSGANLLSWFSLGILAAAPVAMLVPEVGGALAFLLALFGLLAALLAHAVAEHRSDRGAIVRVSAAYLLAAVSMSAAALWFMAALLAAGAVVTMLQAQRWDAQRLAAQAPAFS